MNVVDGRSTKTNNSVDSDSTHKFFRNACTKSGSLRFSQFSILVCVFRENNIYGEGISQFPDR
jgi:hypothetical protein